VAASPEDPGARYRQPLAELIVDVGLGMQAGQVVAITSEPGMEPLMRAVAAQAYARGALYVDPWIFDVHVKHSRLLHAPEDTLNWIPPWLGARLRALAEINAAWVTLLGPVAPNLMEDIEPRRLGLDSLPRVPDSGPLIGERLFNWTIAPSPNPGWAAGVYPELPAEQAYQRLWDEIAHICRLDEPDPKAAWLARLAQLESVAVKLTELKLDALRFIGPGTDLTVGLLPSSRWAAGREETAFGVLHTANIPTEEVFTAPDPQWVDGSVRSTKPLFLYGGIVEGLQVSFEAGRVVAVDADRGAEAVRALIERDDGAARLGEVALVDRASRIAQTGTVFYETILDENAASHIALGRAYTTSVSDSADLDRLNVSAIHIDFMIGSDDVTVTGLLADGSEIPLLRGGDWQI
jgi:aminopeptidase